MALQKSFSPLSKSSASGPTSVKGLGHSKGTESSHSYVQNSLCLSEHVPVDSRHRSRRLERAQTSRINSSLETSTSGRHLFGGNWHCVDPLWSSDTVRDFRFSPFRHSGERNKLAAFEGFALTRNVSRDATRRRDQRIHRTLAAAMSGGLEWPVIGLESQTEGDEGDVSEPLSCLYIGPIDDAEKAHLEALYMQARDSYYSGQPLIVDEMFDKVETRLRNLRSKMVLKYPRCSLKKFAAYSDAEEDTSQMSTLMVVWGALGLAGAFAAVVPPLCAATRVCDRLVNEALEPMWAAQSSPLANFLLALGLLGGVPLASAAVQQVKSLLRGEVVALKGCCPSCGEEVYAFLDAKEHKPRHKSECHVCEHPLVFHATVETSKKDNKQWAYGRVYLVTRSKDLEPQKQDSSVR